MAMKKKGYRSGGKVKTKGYRGGGKVKKMMKGGDTNQNARYG